MIKSQISTENIEKLFKLFWVQNGNTSSMCLIRGYIFCEPNHSPKIRHGVVPRDCVWCRWSHSV